MQGATVPIAFTTAINSLAHIQEWRERVMSAPDTTRRRSGHFSASGEYLWFGLSDGLDEHKEQYEMLDLRRKVGFFFPRCLNDTHHSCFSCRNTLGWQGAAQLSSSRLGSQSTAGAPLPCGQGACHAHAGHVEMRGGYHCMRVQALMMMALSALRYR